MPSGSRQIGPFGMVVASILSDARNAAQVSLQALNETSGVNYSQLSRMLAGQKPMTLDEYVAICEALRLDPESVMAQACLAHAAISSTVKQPEVKPPTKTS